MAPWALQGGVCCLYTVPGTASTRQAHSVNEPCRAALAAELAQLDGLEGPENAVMVQAHFESIVRLADEVMELEEGKDAGITMLRAAFKLCPACPLPFQGAPMAVRPGSAPPRPS